MKAADTWLLEQLLGNIAALLESEIHTSQRETVATLMWACRMLEKYWDMLAEDREYARRKLLH